MNVSAARLKTEFRRKAIHLATGIVPLAYAFGLPRGWTVAALAGMVAAMLAVEVFRRRDTGAGRLFRYVFGSMLREKESGEKGWLGATYYCLAALACVVAAPKEIAVLAAVFLAAGDTAASIVGLGWGRHRVGNKSWEGFAGFVAASVAAAGIANGLAEEYPFWIGVAGAIAGGLAELFLPKWDDNWTIPIAAAGVMMGLGWASGHQGMDFAIF